MDSCVVFLLFFLWNVTMISDINGNFMSYIINPNLRILFSNPQTYEHPVVESSSTSTETTDHLETTTPLPSRIVVMAKGLSEIPLGAENVVSINYGYNHIADLPAYVFTMNGYRSVHKIELSQNRISNVSQKAFKELKQLRTLDLSGNNISTLNTATFKSNLRLQKLDLSNNRIDFHHAKPFLNSISLETLILTDNRIEHIFEATFTRLPSLRILIMDNNIIFSIEQRSFASMQHLHFLSLAHTGVYRLGEDLFNNNSYPRVIDLTETPLANKFDPPLRKVKNGGVINLLALDRYF